MQQDQKGSGIPVKTSPTVMRSALMMSIGTLASRILGMVRDMVFTAMFPRMVTDAFVVAFRLPNLFRRILGEGSLAASFIPLYIEALNADIDEAKKLSNAVYSLLCVVTATLSALGVIFMEPLLGLLVSGESYMQVEGKFELTLLFSRIMFGYLFLVTTYAFYMSIANAHKIFFIPALAPAFFNLTVSIFSFFPQYQIEGDQLAWGVLAGGLLQMITAGYPLFAINAFPALTMKIAVRGTKKFFSILLPSMLGMSIGQILGLLNVNFASRLGEGTHSYIYLADRLLEFPQALLSVSLGVALLPTLSQLWAKEDKTQFLQIAQKHVRLLATLSYPCALGLFVLARPIIEVLYQRGQFSTSDTETTAVILEMYAIVLVVSGLHRVTVPAFYAIKNTWLPAANSAFCLVVHYFIADFGTEYYGLKGLIAATALTGSINLLILLIAFRYYFGDLGVVKFAKSGLHLLPALVVMAAVAHYAYLGLYERLAVSNILALALTITLSGGVFFLIGTLIGHPDLKEIQIQLSRRLGNKFKSS